MPMRCFALAAFALTTALTPVFAGEFTAISRIDAVTVFPRGAEVTRLISLALPAGEHNLIIGDLPGDIDVASVRVEGFSATGLAIGSVDVRAEVVSSDDTEARRKEIEARIEALETEMGSLERAIADQNFQKELLSALGRIAINPRRGEGQAIITAGDLEQLLDVAAGRLKTMTDTVTAAEARQRAIAKEIEELRRQEQLLAPQQTYRTVLTIALTADAGGEARFAVRYGVEAAGWSPVYDARLDTGSSERAPAIALVSRAEVLQRSAETWPDVALTLSTARVTGATEAPELQPEPLAPRPPVAPMEMGAVRQKAAPMAPGLQSEELSADQAMAGNRAREDEAQVDVAGFQALYQIAGRQSVGNAGEAKGVRIATQDMNATLEAVSVPRLDTNTYLTARFTLAGEAPSLPGAVMIYRDGVFLGRGSLPLLNPGEEHALGFGLDDRVKVKRAETLRKSSQTGIISTDNVEERAYSTEIENLHARAIAVRLIDRMPFSTHEDIKVEMLAGMTGPDERNVEKKRGIMAWTRSLKAGAKETINFGYRVSWPKEMMLPPIQ
jgi:uncharacterized protein (TIGR02231 family)